MHFASLQFERAQNFVHETARGKFPLYKRTKMCYNVICNKELLMIRGFEL